MNKAFVTGASGFIGSTLVDDLLKRGFSVKCAIRKSSNLQWLEGKNVELCEIDLFDEQSIVDSISGCNYIFHIAGMLFGNSEQEYLKGNLELTKNIVDASLKSDTEIKRFVYVSSIIAAGSSSDGEPMTESDLCRPFTWYGKSKFESETYLIEKKDKLPFSIIRPGAVYGPRDYALFIMFQFSKLGINAILGEKGKLGSMIHISDLTSGIINAALSGNAKNEIYFLANDEFRSQEYFSEIIIIHFGKKPINIVIPYWFLNIGAYMSEIYCRIFNKIAIFNHQKLMELRERYLICSNNKAQRDFGFEQKISLEDGVKSTMAWYKENKWL